MKTSYYVLLACVAPHCQAGDFINLGFNGPDLSNARMFKPDFLGTRLHAPKLSPRCQLSPGNRSAPIFNTQHGRLQAQDFGRIGRLRQTVGQLAQLPSGELTRPCELEGELNHFDLLARTQPHNLLDDLSCGHAQTVACHGRPDEVHRHRTLALVRRPQGIHGEAMGSVAPRVADSGFEFGECRQGRARDRFVPEGCGGPTY